MTRLECSEGCGRGRTEKDRLKLCRWFKGRRMAEVLIMLGAVWLSVGRDIEASA